MNNQDGNILNHQFDNFFRICLAGKYRKRSQNSIQFLLDQLTIFLNANTSFIVSENNLRRVLYQSSLTVLPNNYNIMQLSIDAMRETFYRTRGIIFKSNHVVIMDDKNKAHNNQVLSIPIYLTNSYKLCLQVIRYDDIDQFHSSDLEFVNKIARIITPFLKNEKDELITRYVPGKTLSEKKLRDNYDFSAIIGHNNKIIELLDLITKIVDVDVPILIEGESGTGKELITRAIHSNSKRRKYPLVSINCGAIPENLLESEFFGHEKGAFTNAMRKKMGQFEYADNGIIFLDEIGTLNLALQVKLLRILQWNEFTPVGSNVSKKVNVRVIAASNQKLSELVEQKKFRNDLYYRLNVLRFYLPPLRERKDDIPVLCHYFIERTCKKLKREKVSISPNALDTLMNYNFPGNIRELENIIQRAIILCEGKEINYTHLPFEVKKNGNLSFNSEKNINLFKNAKQRVIEEFEQQFIIKRLIENRGIVLRAAKQCGMYEANFRAKMKKYNICVDNIFEWKLLT